MKEKKMKKKTDMMKIGKNAAAAAALAVSLAFGFNADPLYAADSLSTQVIAQQSETSEAESTGTKETKTNFTGDDLEDGSYPIEVSTGSPSLQVSEAVLTVESGKMILHLTYKDGTDEDVEIDELDAPVLVKDTQVTPLSSSLPDGALKSTASKAYQALTYKEIPLMAGTWDVSVSLEGGSGRASVKSPCKLTVDEDGKATALIEWSSNHYDYMIVGGEKYTPVSNSESGTDSSASGNGTDTAENSRFEIPVAALDEAETVIADTTAMSKPHEIEYKLTFSSKSASREKTTRKTTMPERLGGIVAVVVLAFLGALGFKKLMDRKVL